MTEVLPLHAWRASEPADGALAAGSPAVVLTGGEPSALIAAETATGDHGWTRALGGDAGGGYFAYRQDFRTVGGVRKTRLGLVGLLDPAARDVWPAVDVDPVEVHGARAELARGGLQREPVVCGFEDLQFELDKLLEEACQAAPEPVVDWPGPDGDRHRLWRVEQPETIGRLRAFFRERGVFLLDGLPAFRALRRAAGRAGEDDPSATRRPLAVFLNLFDFGVALTARHVLLRRVPEFDINELVLRLSGEFLHDAYPFDEDRGPARAITRFKEDFRILGFTDRAFGAYFRDNPQLFIFRLREGADLGRVFLPDVGERAREFDAFLLRKAFLERYVTTAEKAGSASAPGYARTVEEAVHGVKTGAWDAAFFLNAPNKRKLIGAVRDGVRLPPGSVALDPPLPVDLLAHRT